MAGFERHGAHKFRELFLHLEELSLRKHQGITLLERRTQSHATSIFVTVRNDMQSTVERDTIGSVSYSVPLPQGLLIKSSVFFWAGQ